MKYIGITNKQFIQRIQHKYDILINKTEAALGDTYQKTKLYCDNASILKNTSYYTGKMAFKSRKNIK